MRTLTKRILRIKHRPVLASKITKKATLKPLTTYSSYRRVGAIPRSRIAHLAGGNVTTKVGHPRGPQGDPTEGG